MLLRNDGSCRVIPVCEKEYIGPTKYVMLADKDQFYSILYYDKVSTVWYAKCFSLGQYTPGREYHIIPPDCIIKELYTNTGVVVELKLKQNNRRSYNSVKVDFNDKIYQRTREARGIKVTGYQVDDIVVIDRGTKGGAVPGDLSDSADEGQGGATEQLNASDTPILDNSDASQNQQQNIAGSEQPSDNSEDAAQNDAPKLKKRIDENSIFTLE